MVLLTLTRRWYRLGVGARATAKPHDTEENQPWWVTRLIFRYPKPPTRQQRKLAVWDPARVLVPPRRSLRQLGFVRCYRMSPSPLVELEGQES